MSGAAPLRRRVGRYTAGSVIAGVVSEVAFLAVYGLGLAGPQGATVVAFLAGAVPNYFLNRRWTWERTGRAHPVRELLPYVATIVTSALIASAVTGFVDARVADWFSSRPVQVAVVALSFGATYGVLFVLKFLVFDVLFGGRRRAAPAPTVH